MKQKIIFFDRNQPYLIFPAAAMFLQMDGTVHVEPTQFSQLITKELQKNEEAYILDFTPDDDEECRLWANFQLRNSGKIKLWISHKHEHTETCLPALIQSGYRIPSSWKYLADEAVKRDLNTKNQPVERLLRAYQAQATLDFNTDHHGGINKFLVKATNELITEQKNAEIDALAKFHQAAQIKLEQMMHFWGTTNLRSKIYNGYPFKNIPLLNLESNKEIDSFLDLQELIRRIKKRVPKFILEYNCRGRIHYILYQQDNISRKSYHDKISTYSARIKAAHKLLPQGI
jgi:hypothetical protein